MRAKWNYHFTINEVRKCLHVYSKVLGINSCFNGSTYRVDLFYVQKYGVRKLGSSFPSRTLGSSHFMNYAFTHNLG